ncbi:MAG: threonine--tRNA ligase [Actinobacteria bacterium]|nr:threonine--tRNA ligase [Actinomycetota bacterium]
MNVILPDGSQLSVPEGATALAVAEAIGARLAKAAVAAKIGDRLVDLATPVHEGDQVSVVTLASEEGVEVLRHSSAHVLAQAATRVYPGTKVAIGPAIKDGFYYDFEFPEPITEDALARFQAEMERSIKEAVPFTREEITREEALSRFADEPYKVELIRELPEGETISLYRHGDFVDLCRGPHLPDTGRIPAVKVLSTAGAYWRGDSDNAMLTRVYGTSFPSKKELQEHLERLEMARQRDHRKLGRELDLFSFHDEGPGFPFFHAKGMRVVNALLEYWRAEHRVAGYEEIKTPIILDRALWERSGHWDNYKDNMYFTRIDEGDFAVKPMNCPGGILVYRSAQHSYREFPLRMAELGLVHRHELSGVLHGLFRVRTFTQDDAHIYCLPEQIEDEVVGVIELVMRIYRTFGFQKVHLELSTRPEKSIGSSEMWEAAERSLAVALDRTGLEYRLNPGDGAFYGPKIDFHIEDVMGRTWQCATCQLDFAMPERFDLEYVGVDNQRHRPVMIHRTVLGSIERFLGILIEHYGGAFPAWLAPLQAVVIPVADRHNDYAAEVAAALGAAGVRAEVDDRTESVGRKIRDNEVAKVPYMLVVGDREVEVAAVSLRSRAEGDLGHRERGDAVREVADGAGVPVPVLE